jgi:hypothetical protein
MPPRTSTSVASSCGEAPSRQSGRPGGGIWRTAAVVVSQVHTLYHAHTEDRQSHPATDRPPNSAGTPLQWRSRIGTAGASSEMSVGAPSYATCWGMLKQPYNQKARKQCSSRPGPTQPLWRITEQSLCKAASENRDSAWERFDVLCPALPHRAISADEDRTESFRPSW